MQVAMAMQLNAVHGMPPSSVLLQRRGSIAGAHGSSIPHQLDAGKWQLQQRGACSSRRQRHTCRAESETTPESPDTPAPAKPEDVQTGEAIAAADASTNGAPAAMEITKGDTSAELPAGELKWDPPSGGRKFLTSLSLLRALPWRKFKKGSALVIELGGEINEQRGGRFASPSNIPTICEALHKAALDPRVDGIYFKLAPLAAGWAKLAELRRHMEAFAASGKWTVAWMSQGGEKEYYLASACKEVFVPPTAGFSLRGFKVAGTFLRGVLDKVGVEPELVRIGKYKSAGDQLLRRDMSEAQAEQLSALLDDIYTRFTKTVASARGKSEQEVAEMLDCAFYDQSKFLEGGWVDGLKYEDEILDLLRERTGAKKDEKTGLWKGRPKAVALKKYAAVSPSAFGINSGKKRIVVIRAGGPILGGGGAPSGGQIKADAVIKQMRAVEKDKGVAAVVLRVDSPGGDALASDLMWRQIQRTAKHNPVIASMGDVAASGGYYMAMACSKIVAEALTITGSIGVISGKFSLASLYERVGYSKTTLSRGRWAQLEAEEKAFTPDEKDYFAGAAQYAYESFRNKAAESRGMEVERMQDRAQGRVWSGAAALEQGLVDAIGGVPRAIAIAKQAAKIGEGERVRVQEVSRQQVSPLALVTGGASAAATGPAAMLGLLQLAFLALTQPSAVAAEGGSGGGMAGLLAAAAASRGSGGFGGSSIASQLSSDPLRPLALMPDLQVDGAHSACLQPASSVSADGMDILRQLL